MSKDRLGIYGDKKTDEELLEKRVVELTMENSELRDRLIELGECDDIVENRGKKYLVSDVVKDENQLELFED